MPRDPHAETKLRQLLLMLFDFRHELEAAEIRGDRVTADTARNLIRTQHAIIRHHCRAMGLPQWRIFTRHILPNLVGPITVYATLTVPSAILQESFLSFLSVGINPPLPTWGSLASDAIGSLSPVKIYWWMLLFPCLLLVVTLLSLNFVGDGLRDVFDPKREQGKL